jgi:hypothetical protein
VGTEVNVPSLWTIAPGSEPGSYNVWLSEQDVHPRQEEHVRDLIDSGWSSTDAAREACEAASVRRMNATGTCTFEMCWGYVLSFVEGGDIVFVGGLVLLVQRGADA